MTPHLLNLEDFLPEVGKPIEFAHNLASATHTKTIGTKKLDVRINITASGVIVADFIVSHRGNTVLFTHTLSEAVKGYNDLL